MPVSRHLRGIAPCGAAKAASQIKTVYACPGQPRRVAYGDIFLSEFWGIPSLGLHKKDGRATYPRNSCAIFSLEIEGISQGGATPGRAITARRNYSESHH
ncbi:MAG: hypothetical protein ACM3ZE_08710 [Myxococcales bacterium]